MTKPQPLPSPGRMPGAPAHLAPEEASLFAQIARAYGLRDEVSLRILEEAMVSLQNARECHEQIAREGRTFLDKGKPKPHPLLVTERDARAAALAAFRQLNLELPKSASHRSVG